MPVTRNHFSCGHKGRGAECRRCLQASRLLQEAEGLRVGPRRNELIDEAARLKSPDGKPSAFLRTELQITTP